MKWVIIDCISGNIIVWFNNKKDALIAWKYAREHGKQHWGIMSYKQYREKH